MAKRSSSKTPKTVKTLKHDEATRKNIPTAEYQSVMAEEEKNSIRVAYERRNRDLDPQLVWRGKDEQDWSDLVVNAPPLYIQEKVQPKVIIDDLVASDLWRVARGEQGTNHQPPTTQLELDLFADFNGLPKEATGTDFYQHDGHWSNRMILGDSLQVMASLAEREGLRGKVQCIYIDPPYGIKFNSNFQWSTTSRDVKDGKVDHITREPEQVKAFRDTWRDGIHSYLTYLRDRLVVARDLLTDSGSVFVQIGDENIHRVRALMEEIFGEDNFISQLSIYKTTTPRALIDNNLFYILWFSKSKEATKYRQIHFELTATERLNSATGGSWGFYDGYEYHNVTKFKKGDRENNKIRLELYQLKDLTSAGKSSVDRKFSFQRKSYRAGKNKHWKTDIDNLYRLSKAGRVEVRSGKPWFRRFHTDFAGKCVTNVWSDTSGKPTERLYVVQTQPKVIERCMLMTTDPGDLVIDPTCGSGTTAYLAEQWGRRWITIDTSRVALALARARIMGARYPYYLLADSKAGQQKEADITRTPLSETPTYDNIRQGFVYQRVPHITLKSIANNAEIDTVWETHQEKLEPLREQLNAELDKTWEEWEIPREANDKWSDTAKQLHTDWWQARIARQKEIDASIAAKADQEFLYDKPYEDKSIVRVAGPFTVESLSPHRVLAVDQDDELVDSGESDQWPVASDLSSHKPQTTSHQSQTTNHSQTDFANVILENLKTAGVQQAHKEDKIAFTSITGWPGHHICAEGQFEVDSDQWLVTSGQSSHKPQTTSHKPQTTNHKPQTTQKRAGIFIGPEFGTVSRPDLVAAAREAGDAGFDVLITCAFNYDAHSAEFTKLGRIPVLKARMNADLHMADTLKNTGAGNLFVIFGEPDIDVVSGQWLVASNGRWVVNYDIVAELSGLGSLEEINRLGREDLSGLKNLSPRGEIRTDESTAQGGSVSASQHSRGSSPQRDRGVSSISEHRQRIASGSRNAADSGPSTGVYRVTDSRNTDAGSRYHWTDAQRAQAIAALETLTIKDFPLTLTTNHQTQVTIHGVDVFHPQSGEVRSSNTDEIACWFIDTDYNEESFFVRHAYFLGASDPYKSLKTTLKAEIDAEAWATLYSNTSRPFNKPESGRIAVKVINHLGDEVMKVFNVS